MRKLFLTAVLLALAGIGAPASAAPRHVIVIAMENKDAWQVNRKSESYVYGNKDHASFLLDTLAPQAARADNFQDELAGLPSEPHYIAMEAGTNVFPDTTFTCDKGPNEKCDFFSGQKNWTKSPDHLVHQMKNHGISWMTYQEDIGPETGACPVHSDGLYAAKHNPFVFFGDVAGNPPSADNAYCIAHTRELSQFAGDMTTGKLASYVFITPNLCHDMHGASGCGGNPVANGDDFLAGFLPPVIDWAKHNDAVIFLTWDEGKRGLMLPFFAIGAGVKEGYRGKVAYSHRSLVKTIGRIFGLPELAAVKDASDLSDLFQPGYLP